MDAFAVHYQGKSHLFSEGRLLSVPTVGAPWSSGMLGSKDNLIPITQLEANLLNIKIRKHPEQWCFILTQ
jgi:hypothetical protein